MENNTHVKYVLARLFSEAEVCTVALRNKPEDYIVVIPFATLHDVLRFGVFIGVASLSVDNANRL